jgi:hypothetical protein
VADWFKIRQDADGLLKVAQAKSAADVEKVLVKTPVPRLHVLPVGATGRWEPVEAALSGPALLMLLSAGWTVVVDCPAAGLSTAAFELAPLNPVTGVVASRGRTTADELAATVDDLRAVGSWPRTPYDGSRRSLAALKNLTSDLIGRFCGAVQAASGAPGGFARYRADLVVPAATQREIAVLKAVAVHYVMRADDRRRLQERQRALLAELVAVLADRGADALDRPFADDWRAASDDAGRLRVVIDQVASLTDVTAVGWHQRLTGRTRD